MATVEEVLLKKIDGLQDDLLRELRLNAELFAVCKRIVNTIDGHAGKEGVSLEESQSIYEQLCAAIKKAEGKS